MPIWFCIVQCIPAYQNYPCYRILVAEKTTLEEVRNVYDKYTHLLNSLDINPLPQPMYFYRELDESPLVEKPLAYDW